MNSSSSEDDATEMLGPVALKRSFNDANYSDLWAKATTPRGGTVSQSLLAASTTSDLSEFYWVCASKRRFAQVLLRSALALVGRWCQSVSWGLKWRSVGWIDPVPWTMFGARGASPVYPTKIPTHASFGLWTNVWATTLPSFSLTKTCQAAASMILGLLGAPAGGCGASYVETALPSPAMNLTSFST